MHGRFIGEIKRMSIIFYKSFISFIVSLEVSDGAKGTNDRFAIIGMAGGDQNTKGLSKIAATNFGNLSETVWKAHMLLKTASIICNCMVLLDRTPLDLTDI